MTKEERKNWQEEMFSLIRKWKKSGITQKQFCRRHDITIHAFRYWIRKYKQRHDQSAGDFIPVEISPTHNRELPGQEIRIHYPNGVQVIVDRTVSLSRLRALIKTI